ncbi:unnamed protein product [Tilletia laevis]|uniref:Cytochrome c oxidase assembly protein COX11 n=2 Tax=Tilletia TaxID=13289 RepID=A0A177UEK5_9BASI|nr:hypothetical protein CF336_g3203 [Tilletia laevis]KAE8262188.1 hypothetical protein A4X03_0g2651 [Tilletia caries]CAD6899167.1 unnamed protein product [Tilletia controversa]KAE8205075.1 hypothetical protein CF335_g2437 [Tilletia laevis]CAD6893808.1 unnamed protein product [Tilletia caries]
MAARISTQVGTVVTTAAATAAAAGNGPFSNTLLRRPLGRTSLPPFAAFSTCPACTPQRIAAASSRARPASLAEALLLRTDRVQRRANTSPLTSSVPRRHASSTSSSGPAPAARPQPRSSGNASSSNAHARAEEAKAQFYRKRNQSLLLYSCAGIVFVLGTTYAAVPLYRVFCSATGFGGTPITAANGGTTGDGRFDPSRLVPATHDPNTMAPTRRIRVTFNADTSDSLPWSFTPVQKEIYVLPGETALAFFTAENHGKKDIIGIATYNVAPDRIAPFFAKVECFCFEEQRLLAGEEVDMPVFFFLDADMLDEPSVRGVRDVVLSYTFFSARRNKVNGQLEPDTDLEQYRVGKD